MHTRKRVRFVVALATALLMVFATAAQAAIAFQQATMNMTNPTGGNAATSLTIAKPAGLIEGDFMLAQITYEKGSDAGTEASYTPSGWTLLDRRNQSTDLGQAIFYRFATASEASNYSFTFSQSVKAAGAILRYSGVHPTNPIVAKSANNGADGTLTALGVTAEADSMAVALFGVKKNTTLSLPVTYTSRVDYANPQDVKIRAGDRHFSLAGATGNVTSTAGASDKWVAHLVVLRQATPPPVTNTAPGYTAPATQTADTGAAKAVQLGSFTDPDTHALGWNVTVNWGDDTPEENFNVAAAGALGTRNHTYATPGAKTVTVTVSDGIATGSGTFTVNVSTPDTTPPSITFDATGPYAPNGANGWWKIGTAKVKVTAADPSGVGALDCTLGGSSVTLADAGSNSTSRWGDVEMGTDGQRTVSCVAIDGASPANTSDAATHVLKLDTIAPTVTITGVTDGASYTVGNEPAAGCDTADVGGSGVATHATATTEDNGTQKTVSCSNAVDNAGNTAAPVTATYTVNAVVVDPVVHATGFYQPVGVPNSVFVPAGGTRPSPDAATVWNVAKGGQTIPLKFNVYVDDVERSTTTGITFTTTTFACPGTSTSLSDEVDFTTTGNTSLRYDSVERQFIQNWKTPSVSRDTCYRTTVTLHDGSTISAFFRLRK
jgi:hypothetical protein